VVIQTFQWKKPAKIIFGKDYANKDNLLSTVVNGCHKRMHEELTDYNTWLRILYIRYMVEVTTVTEVIIGYYEKNLAEIHP